MNFVFRIKRAKFVLDIARRWMWKDFEATLVDGNGTETGEIIVPSVGGKNGKPKQTFSYMAVRVVGTGSFGVVFQKTPKDKKASLVIHGFVDQASENLGMVMIYTLVNSAKDWLSELFAQDDVDDSVKEAVSKKDEGAVDTALADKECFN